MKEAFRLVDQMNINSIFVMACSHLIDQIEILKKVKYLDQRSRTGCDKIIKFVTKCTHLFSFLVSFSYSVDQM